MRFGFLIIAFFLYLGSFGQIASESFENSSTFTISGGGYFTGNSAAGDRPASTAYAAAGSYGYGGSNTTFTLTSPVYDVSCYNTISIQFRLEAFSASSTTNGMDGTDKVQVYISTNSGASFNPYLEVDGNANAYWAYSATGSATTAYPATATFTPAGGGSRTTDGYSTLSITSLPSSSGLMVKIVATNNSANELWMIDDFKLLGTFIGCGGNTITTGAVSTPPFSVDCATSASGTVAFTSTGTFNAGNIYTAQLSDASGSFASPTNIGTLSSTGNSGTISITIPANTAAGTGYQIQIVASSPATTGSASTSFTITNVCPPTYSYPVLTGVIVDGCNTYSSTPACGTTLDNTNCSEGRTEVIFFRNGTTAISAATVQAMTRHVVDYYTTAWSTLTYYTGVSMNNTATTTSLNSSGCNAGSCGSCFVDAWSNGIPANATFIMVSDYYCIGSTDYSNLCSNSSTSPIYVIYFGASTNNSNNCGGGTTGDWDLSGNFTNYSGTGSVKGIAIDMSSLVAGSPTQYYTYNINSLSNCSGATDGAGVAFSGVSTSTASPTTPNAFTSCACNIPVILPVQLTSFTADRTVKDIMIRWSTSTEVNNDYFEIEYSSDGVNFIPYAKVKGAGNSEKPENYVHPFTMAISYRDLYFRLKQVDFNGGFKYSNIITVTDEGTDQIKSFYNSNNNVIESEVYSGSQQLLNIPNSVNVL